ncbi:ABC-type transport system involved in resistance to organic solvents, permease component [Mycobacteroides abscessus subsp. abscessus]|nr:ABC-type transport system involved in resistance to organic solvents, permease component [Mycobacteroides abscessus subsp. abscessus]
MQQIAPLAAALLVGGAGASAIASDLGARTIREEIDALRTMGIDPHRRLVAPRVVAMTVVAPMLAVLVRAWHPARTGCPSAASPVSPTW